VNLGHKNSDKLITFQKEITERFISTQLHAKILPISCFELAIFMLFLPRVGALAQLARAFDWQSRGHRFDSDMLHTDLEAVTGNTACSCFFNSCFLERVIYGIDRD
jgi:hypothetical protein